RRPLPSTLFPYTTLFRSLGLALDLRDDLRAERVRWQHAGRVAGVDAGLLDVLHDAADPDVVAIAERVDIDFDRVFEEAVEVDLADRKSTRLNSSHVKISY